MTSHKLLAWFDQDEALVETHHNAIEALDEGDNRRSFLKKAGIGGALMMGSAALFALAPAERLPRRTAMVGRRRNSARATSASSTMR